MRFGAAIALFVSMISSSCLLTQRSALAQSSTEIENVVRSSKQVDKTRPVRAVLSGKLLTLSTYCHPKATDQDCKINALFILKDLLKHFSTIHKMRISFFDPKNPYLFRSLEISEGDVVLIDSGKPIDVVLSTIDIQRGKMTGSNSQSRNTSSVQSGRSGLIASQSSAGSGQAVPGIFAKAFEVKAYRKFSTSDGEMTISFPEGWKILEMPPISGYVLKVDGPLTQILIGRDNFNSKSLEELVAHTEAMLPGTFKGFQKTGERAQTQSGLRGHYIEGNYDNGKLRIFCLQGRNHCYVLSYIGMTGESGNTINTIFQQIVTSWIVNG